METKCVYLYQYKTKNILLKIFAVTYEHRYSNV